MIYSLATGHPVETGLANQTGGGAHLSCSKIHTCPESDGRVDLPSVALAPGCSRRGSASLAESILRVPLLASNTENTIPALEKGYPKLDTPFRLSGGTDS
jgi:hypothetical protein